MKTIPGFPDYAIAKDGKVWSKSRKDRLGHSRGNRWLKPRLDRKGYLYLTLRCNFKKYTRRIHRLVLETFRNSRPLGMQCRHLNSIRTDNRLKNLCWGTPKENINDRADMGATACGERQGASKLTETKVKMIRYLRKVAKFTLADLAWQFDVDLSTIGRVIRKETWGHI